MNGHDIISESSTCHCSLFSIYFFVQLLYIIGVLHVSLFFMYDFTAVQYQWYHRCMSDVNVYSYAAYMDFCSV